MPQYPKGHRPGWWKSHPVALARQRAEDAAKSKAAVITDREPPLHESTLLWGSFSITFTVIFAILAAVLKDVRWLLIAAWPWIGALSHFVNLRAIKHAPYNGRIFPASRRAIHLFQATRYSMPAPITSHGRSGYPHCAISDRMSKDTNVKSSGPFGAGSYCKLFPILAIHGSGVGCSAMTRSPSLSRASSIKQARIGTPAGGT
jgi:hypothetical protein